jgi:hypothetical protein
MMLIDSHAQIRKFCDVRREVKKRLEDAALEPLVLRKTYLTNDMTAPAPSAGTRLFAALAAVQGLWKLCSILVQNSTAGIVA